MGAMRRTTCRCRSRGIPLRLEPLEPRLLLSAGYSQIDVLFLSDTTGSMGGAIETVQENSSELLSKVSAGLSTRARARSRNSGISTRLTVRRCAAPVAMSSMCSDGENPGR